MSINFQRKPFRNRHIGPDEVSQKAMLKAIGAETRQQLIQQTIPQSITLPKPLDIKEALTEEEFLNRFKEIISKNKIYRSFIGMGYYGTVMPNVIKRNVLENPGWYTAYTPYQAEIAQGRLEALLNFQTMVCDLTGMELANASLLDEGTAAAEAVTMLYGKRKGKKKKTGQTLLIADDCHPQTIEVVKGRLEPLNITIEIGSPADFDVTKDHYFAMLLQNPATDGSIHDYTNVIAAAEEHNITTVIAADLLSLTMIKSPGDMGADVVVGSSQRFGVPMGYGGPHAAFFATKEKYKRQIPGRIIGVTQDSEGNPALRMALQTREQHIRREKATSNICTAQVLLAVIAGFYAVYHGPDGLRGIAERIHGLTVLAKEGLKKLGISMTNKHFFDTLTVSMSNKEHVKAVKKLALKKNINFRYYDDLRIGISFDEDKQISDVEDVIRIFAQATDNIFKDSLVTHHIKEVDIQIPEQLRRPVNYLEHPVFNSFHSEHEMLRYLKQLENRDLSLVHSMISLGSCTMKLNATAEMIPLSWPEVGKIHPFAPSDQVTGYQQLFEELEHQLAVITGFDGVSLQPNSGASGELTGLLIIRAYHQERGDQQRDVTLVPESAHGTNPASAVMAGMNVVVTKCDERGNIDIHDLKDNIAKYSERLAAIMITYPSTHGVFEQNIRDICQLVHQSGGLVYMDGANMNAQIGLTTPAKIGADVCHLNLHKTFCIPHGGGGPGVGPIGVNKKLKPYLPGHHTFSENSTKIKPVASAPWGSASILPISYGYIKLMGGKGLTESSEVAILNANYLKERLKDHYDILYVGKNGRVAHEFILDLRPFRESAGITVTDVAKRLMDYGFHSPTMSWPVPGTLMVEPTESESQAELDRFCNAMISIRQEIAEIEDALADRENNVLKNAPHTQRVVISDEWNRPYSREKAAFPIDGLKFQKFWPSVSRVDDAYGDRNLFCSCIPIQEYAEGQQPNTLEEA